jgi:hypothetical protein
LTPDAIRSATLQRCAEDREPGCVASRRCRSDSADVAAQLADGMDLYVVPIAHPGHQQLRHGQQVIAHRLGFATSIFETWPQARLSVNPIPPTPTIDTTPVRVFG